MKKQTAICDIETKRGIEEALQIAIDEAVCSHYGSAPNQAVKKRIREEWHAIECTDTVLDVAALHNTAMWLQEKGYRYFLSGATGASLIGYLLEIGVVNPLPPHFLCRTCHHFQWIENSSPDSVTASKYPCPIDGASIIADGFDLPWQMLWGYGDYVPAFQIHAEESACDSFQKYASQHWLYRELQETLSVKLDAQGAKYIDTLNLRITFNDSTVFADPDDTYLYVEDIYHDLLGKGFVSKDAWRGAECIRLGEELPFQVDEAYIQSLPGEQGKTALPIQFKAEVLEKRCHWSK